MTDRPIGIKTVWLVAGPALAAGILLFTDLDPEHPEIKKMAAVAVLMALWWVTEAVPLSVTALVPLALYPLLGIMAGRKVAPLYINHIIFLFIGGFIVALAMQRWNLHKRIALRLIQWIGLSPGRMLFGFMFATAFLSMWISNTATTMMMTPIVLAIIIRLEENLERKEARRFSLGLLLGVAYSASIGGISTLIGTPPNLSFVRIYGIYFPNAPEITFASWLAFALPLTIMLFFIVWTYLYTMYGPRKKSFRLEREVFDEECRKLGPLTYEEKVVLFLFSAMAFLWLTRSGAKIGGFGIPGWSSLLSQPNFADDGTVAIAVALILFLVPSKKSGSGRIMDWETAVKLPWGIVLLFGGGFALAGGFKESGLAAWIGGKMSGLEAVHPVILVIAISLLVTFLTEVTSNTATTEMILPVLAGLAVAVKINPLLLMIPATLSASFAFMLPVATPPNAIVFGSGRITIAEMSRVGIVLNFIGAVLITVAIYTTGKAVFGIDPAVFPECCLK